MFSWIQAFGEKGLQCLIKHLRDSCSSVGDVYKRIQHECVRCLKAFMNNKVRFKGIFNFTIIKCQSFLQIIFLLKADLKLIGTKVVAFMYLITVAT